MRVIKQMLKTIAKALLRLLPENFEIRLRNFAFALRNHPGSLKEKLRILKNSTPLILPDYFFPVNVKIDGRKNMLFCHSGHLGDILFSLHFCKEMLESYGGEKFDFHIRTNVTEAGLEKLGYPFKAVRMTQGGAEFIAGLLRSQPYIGNVSCGDESPENAFDLDLFRNLKINFSAGHIANYYYNLVDRHLPRQFYKPVITVTPDRKYCDRIILIATARYRNIFVDMSALEPFREKLVFAGLPEEYTEFCEKYFYVEYIGKLKSMAEIAGYFAGAAGVIGNQSGLFSLAECMKVPRILISADYCLFNKRFAPGPVNVIPQGGWCESVATTEKMVSAVKNLLEYNNLSV